MKRFIEGENRVQRILLPNLLSHARRQIYAETGRR